MKNKILWIIFNISLGFAVLISFWITLIDTDYISEEYLRFLQMSVAMSVVFLILSITNFFFLNIDWTKAIDWWNEE